MLAEPDLIARVMDLTNSSSMKSYFLALCSFAYCGLVASKGRKDAVSKGIVSSSIANFIARSDSQFEESNFVWCVNDDVDHL